MNRLRPVVVRWIFVNPESAIVPLTVNPVGKAFKSQVLQRARAGAERVADIRREAAEDCAATQNHPEFRKETCRSVQML